MSAARPPAPLRPPFAPFAAATWHARLRRLRCLAWLCAVTAASLAVLLLEIGGWAIVGAGAAGLLVLASAMLYLRPALPLRFLHHLDTGGAA